MFTIPGHTCLQDWLETSPLVWLLLDNGWQPQPLEQWIISDRTTRVTQIWKESISQYNRYGNGTGDNSEIIAGYQDTNKYGRQGFSQPPTFGLFMDFMDNDPNKSIIGGKKCEGFYEFMAKSWWEMMLNNSAQFQNLNLENVTYASLFIIW